MNKAGAAGTVVYVPAARRKPLGQLPDAVATDGGAIKELAADK